MNRAATKKCTANTALAPVALMICEARAEPEVPVQKIEPVEVLSSRNSQLGIAASANSGVVTQKQLEARTIYRPGELLEAAPGLIVSQHSGEGRPTSFTCVALTSITAPTCARPLTACLSISAVTPMVGLV